ncbi:PUL domain-containing protein [Ditylenchus destructor]|uniref:PUL domain-containing protein n=1 Tax=Ditylenchus destructor TaxID=166010 RepID=A0AAD4MUG1_9BILA|nr:PUL domain-containing protein [Ditylenchus destructor]
MEDRKFPGANFLSEEEKPTTESLLETRLVNTIQAQFGHVLEYMEYISIQNDQRMKDLETKMNQISSEIASLRRTIGLSLGQDAIPIESARGSAPAREDRSRRRHYPMHNNLNSSAGANVQKEATGNMRDMFFPNNGRCIGTNKLSHDVPYKFTNASRTNLEAGEAGHLNKNLTDKWTRRCDGEYTDSGTDDEEEKKEDRPSNSVHTSITAPSMYVNAAEKMDGGFASYHHENINSVYEVSTSKMNKPVEQVDDNTPADLLQTVKEEQPHLYLSSSANNTNGNTSDLRYAPGSESDTQQTSLHTLMRPDKKRPRSDIIPIRQFFKFGLEGASKKTISTLIEKNNEQQTESKLDDLQISAMKEIMTLNNYQADEAHISALKISIGWSVDPIVPALDVFRVALLNESLNDIFCSIEPVHENRPMGNETIQRLNALLLNDPPVPVRIFCCRALANAAEYKSGRELLLTEISTVSEAVANQLKESTKLLNGSVQVAAASALGNLARLLLLKAESDNMAMMESRENVLKQIISVTEKVDSFSSFSSVALIRLLQAIATLMWGDATVIRLAKNRGILSIISKMNEGLADDAAKAACRDVIEMILSV